jgi:hypothetical protein
MTLQIPTTKKKGGGVDACGNLIRKQLHLRSRCVLVGHEPQPLPQIQVEHRFFGRMHLFLPRAMLLQASRLNQGSRRR